jgi:hypothetical protein
LQDRVELAGTFPVALCNVIKSHLTRVTPVSVKNEAKVGGYGSLLDFPREESLVNEV